MPLPYSSVTMERRCSSASSSLGVAVAAPLTSELRSKSRFGGSVEALEEEDGAEEPLASSGMLAFKSAISWAERCGCSDPKSVVNSDSKSLPGREESEPIFLEKYRIHFDT